MKNFKRHTAIAVIFLLSVVFLCGGCNYYNQDGAVITSYKTYNDKCIYRIAKETGIPMNDEFCDECGKFQKGDTVRWAKKNY